MCLQIGRAGISLIKTYKLTMKILALIPARMGSTRFPGKPMAPILGKPMIGHVFERVSKNPILTLTAVATCNHEIANYIESIKGRAIMTSADHDQSGSGGACFLLRATAAANLGTCTHCVWRW